MTELTIEQKTLAGAGNGRKPKSRESGNAEPVSRKREVVGKIGAKQTGSATCPCEHGTYGPHEIPSAPSLSPEWFVRVLDDSVDST